ncbi:MAG: glycosyltransferase family 4 protein [Verrucomicrobia bacterium]|nr:glycosyltransferase family 4 protein [Verrucomicrobiota bacterium]
MRIGIGLNLLAPDNGGVTNYALTLLRHWPTLAPEHPLVLFSFDHNEPLLATLPPEARRHEIRLRTQEEALDHFAAIDVYFCPFGTLWPRPVRKPSVLTFHDMQERFYPEFFTEKELAERFFHYDWSLRMADAVITISDFTRAMVTDLAGVARSHCHVVPHVADELPAPVRPANLPAGLGVERRFVFYPANFWRHKNHERLLEAFAHEALHGAPVELVCTGSCLGREEAWDGLVARLGLGGRVHHLGKIARSEISWLFRNARALVFPSLFEGFGIPLLEAMTCGCPIACGANTSQPDVAGRAALYFPADDPGAIARAVRRIDADDALRRRLIAAGLQRAPAFNVPRLVDGHLRAFTAARNRYNPARAWWNERVRLPRSLRPRDTLTPHERAAAAALLRQRSQVPADCETLSP